MLPVIVVDGRHDAGENRGDPGGRGRSDRQAVRPGRIAGASTVASAVKRYHDTITSQAAELTELNRTLEERVQTQVEELER